MKPSPAAAPVPSEGAAIGAPAVRGAVWTIGGYAASQIVRLAGNLVLTRLLFPAVFGQMALVYIFILGLAMFSDVGTGPAIVQNPRGDERRFLDTAWTIQCVRGVALWAASWAIAWPAALWYDQPSLRSLIPAAAFTAVLAGFESTKVHSAQRHLRLGPLTFLEVGTQLFGMAATVLLALWHRASHGAGDAGAVWAIIGGNLLASGARLVFSHAALPGARNRLAFDRAVARELFGFGRWIFASTVMTFLASQADRLAFGKLVPLGALGVYSLAAMLAALPTQAVLKLGGSVVFPAYSRVADREEFARVFWAVRWPVLLAGGALVSALVACGPPLVRVLYDDRYADAGWILQYLAVATWFQILECTNGAALLAKGRVRWVTAGSAAKAIALVVAIPVGFRVGGFAGAVGGVVASELVKYLTSAAGAAAAGLRGVGRDLALTAAVAATSAAALAAPRALLPRGGAELASLVASGCIAAASWSLAAASYLRRKRRARATRVEQVPLA